MASYTVDDRDLKRSLNLTIFAGTFGLVFVTVIGNPIGSPIFTGFMRKLGAGDLIYSIVMALPVLGAVSQVFGSYFLEATGERKFLFLSSGLFHRVLWIPVALIPLFLKAEYHQTIIWMITVLITISSIASSMTAISFNSWMGVLVPKDIIGRFFGMRTLMITISGGITALIIGVIVDNINNLMGFAIVFIAGAIFGVCDISFFFFIKHPPLTPAKEKPSLKYILIEPLKNKNYFKFVLFATAFAFGINLTAPFFNVYMIENLHMGYFIINLSNQVMASITIILLVRHWGVLADKFGNKPVLLVGSLVITIVPLLWLFTSPGNITMIFVANIFAGIGWSGYNLAIFNQCVWLAPEQNRSAYVASFTVMTSVFGTASAYICGGIFMQNFRPFFENAHIPFIMGTTLNAFFVLFVISGIVRFLAIVIFHRLYTENDAKPTKEMFQFVLLRLKESIK